MSEKSSSTVPIIIAVIGVVGTIAAALIANWDKISGNSAALGAPAAKVAEHNVAAPELPARVRPGEGSAASSTAVDVAGTWTDSEGHSYVFEQTGGHYSFRQFKNGVEVGKGSGTLDGKGFNHTFESIYGNGSCHGEVSSDGNSSSGTCQIGEGQPYDMTVYRASNAKG